MEFTSDIESTWVKVENTVAERMIDSSLIHKLVPCKLRRRTKMLNKMFERLPGLTSYSYYVKMKSSVVKNLNDNTETEDDEVLSDYEYEQLHRSSQSVNNCNQRNAKNSLSTSQDQVSSDISESQEGITVIKKERNMSCASDANAEENDPTNAVVDWKEVKRYRPMTVIPSSSSYELYTQSMEQEEMVDDPSSSVKSEKLQQHSVSDQSPEALPVIKKHKVSETFKRNLRSDLECERSDVHECKTEVEDLDDEFSLDASNSWVTNPKILGQSTPLRKSAAPKVTEDRLHMFSPKKCLTYHPKDSGIDEDSQEDSSRDGKNNKKKITSEPQVKDKASPRKKRNEGVRKSVDKETKKLCKERDGIMSPQSSGNEDVSNLEHHQGDNLTEDIKPIQNNASFKTKKSNKNKNKECKNEVVEQEPTFPHCDGADSPKEQQIIPRLSRKGIKKIINDKLKVISTDGDTLQNGEHNDHDLNYEEKLADKDTNNVLKDTENVNEQIQMEDPPFAESEGSECPKMTQKAHKSMKRDSVKTKRNKRKRKISNPDMSSFEDTETFCESPPNSNLHENEDQELINPLQNGSENNDEDMKNIVMEAGQKRKLPPKVMHTEVVNKKYKIICRERYDVAMDTSNETLIMPHDGQEKEHDQEESDEDLDSTIKFSEMESEESPADMEKEKDQNEPEMKEEDKQEMGKEDSEDKEGTIEENEGIQKMKRKESKDESRTEKEDKGMEKMEKEEAENDSGTEDKEDESMKKMEKQEDENHEGTKAEDGGMQKMERKESQDESGTEDEDKVMQKMEKEEDESGEITEEKEGTQKRKKGKSEDEERTEEEDKNMQRMEKEESEDERGTEEEDEDAQETEDQQKVERKENVDMQETRNEKDGDASKTEDEEDEEDDKQETIKEADEDEEERKDVEDKQNTDVENVGRTNKLHSQTDVFQIVKRSNGVFNKVEDDELENVTNVIDSPIKSQYFSKLHTRRENNEDEESDDCENDVLSARTVRRLQQLKRLNLIDSDSPSEDELESEDTVDSKISKNNYVSPKKQKTEKVQKVESDAKNKHKSVRKYDSGLHSTEHSQDEEQEMDSSKSVIHTPNLDQKEEATDNSASDNNEPEKEESSHVADERSKIMDKRPTTIEDLTIQDELVRSNTIATFNLKDVNEDEEVYVLNIPSALDVHSLKGKQLVLTTSEIQLGDETYKIKYKRLGAVTCVFHKGKKRASYKVVNTRPIGSITTRYRCIDASEPIKMEECGEDDFITGN